MPLQVVGVGSDQKLWHTLRGANGVWQANFGSVQTQSHGGASAYRAVACGSTDGQTLQVVGLGSDGQLWHTTRSGTSAWQDQFGKIETQSKGGPPSFAGVSCAGAGDDLHIVGVGSDGKLWHTLRGANGVWQANFGSVQTQSHGGASAYRAVACGSTDGQTLQVIGLGSDGQLWHTTRSGTSAWQDQFGKIETQSKGGPPSFAGVSCAGAGDDLHIVGVGSDGKLWHTLRGANGVWQANFGSVQTQSHGGASAYRAVACGSTDGQTLQVIGLGSDGQLWHTTRSGTSAWQDQFGKIETQSKGGPPSFVAVNAAGVGVGTAITKDIAAKIPMQDQSQWCWVAVGSGISNYYDRIVRSQCSVVTLVFQTIHPPFTLNCCDPASQPSQAPCNGESGADQALDHPTHHFNRNSGPLDVAGIRAELDAGRPIAAEILWQGGGAHFVGITGYETSSSASGLSLHLQDPAYGASICDFDQFVSAYQGIGSYSSTTFSQP